MEKMNQNKTKTIKHSWKISHRTYDKYLQFTYPTQAAFQFKFFNFSFTGVDYQ